MNMSYCRFANTATDLSDCVENLRSLGPDDRGQNTSEEREARARIIRLAADLLCELGIEDPADPHGIDAAIRDLDHEPAEVEDDEYA